MRDGPRSVDRIIDLLELFAGDRSPKSLAQLSVALDVPKASLFNLIGTLARREVLSRDDTGRYQLGAAAVRIAMAVMATRSFTDLTHPFLVRLSRLTGETALVACLDMRSLKAVYLDKAESDSSVRYTVPIGQTRELHCSSVGKVMLAHCPDVAELVLRAPRLRRYTDSTVVDKKALQNQIRAIRKAGVARAIDESSFGASGIAAPIFNGAGELVAGLVVAGPTQRMRPNLQRFERALREAAASQSGVLPSVGTSQIAFAIEDVMRRHA